MELVTKSFLQQQLLQATQDGAMLSPDSLPQLPLPMIDGNKTQVLLQSPAPYTSMCSII